MDRVDFYRAMGIEYEIGSISYTVTAKGNAVNSFITGHAVEYLFAEAGDVVSTIVSEVALALYTQEPGDYIVNTIVASVYDPIGDWYENVITYEVYYRHPYYDTYTTKPITIRTDYIRTEEKWNTY